MTKIIKNAANVVLYAGDTLTLTAQQTSNGNWIDPGTTSSNATLVDGILDLPADWMGGNYTHINGVWALTTQGQAASAAAVAVATEAQRIAGIDAAIAADPKLSALKTATNAQIDTWMANNVTSLAQARDVLALLVRIITRRLF